MFVAEELCDTVAFINEGKIVASDSPRNLKLKYGEKSVKVEYRENGKVNSEVLFIENDKDKDRLNKLINNQKK